MLGGTQRAHATERRKYRRRLQRQGVPDRVIDLVIERMRQRQYDERHPEAAPRAPQIDEKAIDAYYEEQEQKFSDGAYRPLARDPLLHGPARATGQTAKAVKRRKGTTKFEHDGCES